MKVNLKTSDQVQRIFQTTHFRNWFSDNVGFFYTSARWDTYPGSGSVHNRNGGVTILVTHPDGQEYDRPTSPIGATHMTVLIYHCPSAESTSSQNLAEARRRAGKL